MEYEEEKYQVRVKSLKCEIYVNIIVQGFFQCLRVISYKCERALTKWMYRILKEIGH